MPAPSRRSIGYQTPSLPNDFISNSPTLDQISVKPHRGNAPASPASCFPLPVRLHLRLEIPHHSPSAYETQSGRAPNNFKGGVNEQFERRGAFCLARTRAARGADRRRRSPARRGHGRLVSYSRKVFIPLTQLCRDVCHYCTFAERPRAGRAAYLSPDEVLAIARAGRGGRLHGGAVHPRRQAGAALPRRARGAGRARARNHDRLPRAMCALVLRETGLLPHVNPGRHDPRRDRGACGRCRRVRASCWNRSASGCASRAACTTARPTSAPAARLETMRLAGELARAVHDRHPDRHRRDARASGSRRCFAIRDLHRQLRAHPGSHRPELPRQARHQARAARRSRISTTCCGPSPRRA